jgi:hypothetical protein
MKTKVKDPTAFLSLSDASFEVIKSNYLDFYNIERFTSLSQFRNFLFEIQPI